MVTKEPKCMTCGGEERRGKGEKIRGGRRDGEEKRKGEKRREGTITSPCLASGAFEELGAVSFSGFHGLRVNGSYGFLHLLLLRVPVRECKFFWLFFLIFRIFNVFGV